MFCEHSDSPGMASNRPVDLFFLLQAQTGKVAMVVHQPYSLIERHLRNGQMLNCAHEPTVQRIKIKSGCNDELAAGCCRIEQMLDELAHLRVGDFGVALIQA